MIIFIGLGNPGEKFEHTRHNIGFMAVDFFAKKNNFPEFRFSKGHKSEISQKEKIMLTKPQTFMNKSGIAVKKIIAQNKKADLMVIHDDIDLPIGRIKIVKNRGSAGHKGVESVIKNIGNRNLIRLRIGIRPATKKPKNPENFVIKNFTKEEREIINKAIEKVPEILGLIAKEGLEKAMNKYNR